MAWFCKERFGKVFQVHFRSIVSPCEARWWGICKASMKLGKGCVLYTWNSGYISHDIVKSNNGIKVPKLGMMNLLKSIFSYWLVSWFYSCQSFFFFSSNYIVSVNYFIMIIICLHTVIWFQVFQSNSNNFQTDQF